MDKGRAILEAIRKTDVGSAVIIHNEDKSVWCILRIIAKEHEEPESLYCCCYASGNQQSCPIHKCRHEGEQKNGICLECGAYI